MVGRGVERKRLELRRKEMKIGSVGNRGNVEWRSVSVPQEFL